MILSDFLVALAIIFGAAIFGGALLSKLRQPSMLGFLAVGIVLGPYGLGVFKEVELVNLLAELGIILLLFVVGLEFNLTRLRRLGGIVLTISIVEQAVMFLMGYWVGFTLGWNNLESLFIGGTLAISSTSIIVKIL